MLQLTSEVGSPPGWAGQGPGLAGLLLGPGHPLGLQPPLPAFPASVRGRPECPGGCCSHLKTQLHPGCGHGPGLGRTGCLPACSCPLAHLPKQGVSEGSRAQFPLGLPLLLHTLWGPHPSGSLPFLRPLSSGSSPELPHITSLFGFDSAAASGARTLWQELLWPLICRSQD